MTENTDNAPFDPALGAIEPHAGMLTAPPAGQQLYKIMTVENLLRSVSGGYLYFNRVDSYKDFRNADGHDGEQLQQDRAANEAARFERASDFSGADYYDRCRNRPMRAASRWRTPTTSGASTGTAAHMVKSASLSTSRSCVPSSMRL